MNRFRAIAHQVGELVETKNAAYGDSFSTAGAALRLLYPRGIPPEKLNDALLVGRVWDKLMRVATDRDAFGESPWVDIAGYAILGIEIQTSQSLKKGGKVGTQSSAAVSVAGMHKTGGRSRSILLERMPYERLSRAQKSEARELPSLRKTSEGTGKAKKGLKRPANKFGSKSR
jgi:hypothetical protein